MSKAAEIRDAIGKMAGGKKKLFHVAVVKTVEGKTCTVTMKGMDITGVHLTAADDQDENYCLVTPAEGSKVLVADLSQGELRSLTVVKYTKVDALEYKNSGVVFKVKEGKLSFKNASGNLKGLFNNLVTELKAAVVQTPAGPGNMSPATITKLDTVNTLANNLLDDGTE